MDRSINTTVDNSGKDKVNNCPQTNIDYEDDTLRAFIQRMGARLKRKGTLTENALSHVLDECEELVFHTRDFCKSRVKNLLREKKLLNDSGIKAVLQVFEFKSPFEEEPMSAISHGNDTTDASGSVDRISPVLDGNSDEVDGILEDNIDIVEIKVEQPILNEAPPQVLRKFLRVYPKKTSATRRTVSPDPIFPSHNIITSAPAANAFTRYETVEQTLMNYREGEKVMKAARSLFTEADRRILIRIVVSELVDTHNNNHYPPEEAKAALAEAIVTEFPRLKDNDTETGYEHYYDRKNKKGFIEYRLWTMRKNINPSEKKYITKNRLKELSNNNASGIGEMLSQEVLDEKITWMMCQTPAENNDEAIATCMMETFRNRREWIKNDKPSINEIFSVYPRLIDRYDTMINKEFKFIFPEFDDDLPKKFLTFYTPRLIEYAKENRRDVYNSTKIIKNDGLRAVAILTAILPTCNFLKRKKGKRTTVKGKKRRTSMLDEEKDVTDGDEDGDLSSTEIPNKLLLQIISEGNDCNELIQDIRGKGNNAKPFIVYILGQQKDTCFVRADNYSISAHPNADDFVVFDLLFKCYHVLNIPYPSSLQYFFNFFDYYVYKITTKVPGVVSSMAINISNT